jgi:hypothetical protein
MPSPDVSYRMSSYSPTGLHVTLTAETLVAPAAGTRTATRAH